MTRRLFGDRKGRQQPFEQSDWPQVPQLLRPAPVEKSAAPFAATATPPAIPAANPSPVMPEDELLDRIAAFRGAVADSLKELSTDYRILSKLTQEELISCDDIIEELRRRLADNIHYRVLGKLDEVQALVTEHLDRKG